MGWWAGEEATSGTMLLWDGGLSFLLLQSLTEALTTAGGAYGTTE